MALSKENTKEAGVTFSYHRVAWIYIERATDGLPESATMKVRVDSYLDAGARAAGKSPFAGLDVMLPVAALAETVLTQDHVGMTAAQLVLGAVYVALKEDELFSGAEDC